MCWTWPRSERARAGVSRDRGARYAVCVDDKKVQLQQVGSSVRAYEREFNVFMITVLIVVLCSLLVLIALLRPSRTWVPIATAVASGLVLVGSWGQAAREWRRSRRIRAKLFPLETGRTYSLAMKSLSPIKARRERYMKELQKAFDDAHRRGRAMPRDQLAANVAEVADSLQSARNWVFILCGSALLMAASIRDSIG